MSNNFKLVIFDMDGVLVDINSSWYHVHRKLNVDSSKNLQKYLAAEIDYSEFMRRDIRLWGRCHIVDIRNMFSNVPLMNGAIATTRELKNRGYQLAILSAGISLLAERVQKELAIDYVFANKIIGSQFFGTKAAADYAQGQDLQILAANVQEELDRLGEGIHSDKDCIDCHGDHATMLVDFEKCSTGYCHVGTIPESHDESQTTCSDCHNTEIIHSEPGLFFQLNSFFQF